MTPEIRALITALVNEGEDVRASFGYLADYDPRVTNWQDWRVFTKTWVGASTSCDSRSSVLIADLIEKNDAGGILTRVRKHYARIREEIAAGQRFVFKTGE